MILGSSICHFQHEDEEQMEDGQERKNTVGYTENDDYRCLEDLKESRFSESSNMIRLDYCGMERCTPGYAFGPYTRENYVLHFILKGKGTLQVKGKLYRIGKDQAFLLRPGVETVYQADQEDPWTYAWIGFHGYQCADIIERMGFTPQEDVIDVENAEALAGYISRMLDRSELTFADHLRRSAFLELLIADIVAYADVPEKEEHLSEEAYVEMAVKEITANFEHPLRISGIANKIGINRSYLSILFKKRMGVSPQQYLIDFRLEKAAGLILETDMAIRAIASVVGYADPLTFSKAFKQKYGCSPSLYRQNLPMLMKTDLKGEYTGIHNL